MNLLDYLIGLGIGEVNVEEDYKLRMVVVRTSKALTEEQRRRCEAMVLGMPIRYVVVSR